jgi:3-phenylpropionate/trans-cinnamate dioxygenase ferredoxin reductase component
MRNRFGAKGFSPECAVPSMSDDILIIGAGQAAAQCAISLRQGGFADAITLVGDEPFPPYQRPPLSKKFLTERGKPESLLLRPESVWRDQNVTLALGVAAIAADTRTRTVKLSDGRISSYRALVFATGACARPLPVPGADFSGVFSLRSITDVQRLRPVLDAVQRVVIVGAGYIGLEVAAVMRSENREAIVLEAEDRVLKRVTAPEVSDFFERFHRARGVDIRLGKRLAAILGKRDGAATHVAGLRLSDGSEIATDLVLLATGAQPNVEIARAAGIACNDGIVVDDCARTSAPNVYAAGDCTRFPSRRYGRDLRLESVQNAIDQAKAAAAAILNKASPYDPVPWFWSDQYEIKLQIAGLLDGYDKVDIVGDPTTAKFSAEYRKNGRLIAVDAINDGRAHMLARRRIAEETATEPAGAT